MRHKDNAHSRNMKIWDLDREQKDNVHSLTALGKMGYKEETEGQRSLIGLRKLILRGGGIRTARKRTRLHFIFICHGLDVCVWMDNGEQGKEMLNVFIRYGAFSMPWRCMTIWELGWLGFGFVLDIWERESGVD